MKNPFTAVQNVVGILNESAKLAHLLTVLQKTDIYKEGHPTIDDIFNDLKIARDAIVDAIKKGDALIAEATKDEIASVESSEVEPDGQATV